MWHTSRCHPGILLKGLRMTTKHLCTNRDSNWARSECESDELPLELTCSLAPFRRDPMETSYLNERRPRASNSRSTEIVSCGPFKVLFLYDTEQRVVWVGTVPDMGISMPHPQRYTLLNNDWQLHALLSERLGTK
jgi:hypothetical protein